MQHNVGLSGQVTSARTRGGTQPAHGRRGVRPQPRRCSCSRRELGYLNPDRSVTGVGAFADGVTGGNVDGEPSTRASISTGASTPWSVYATDTLSLGAAWHVTLSGRYNRTTIDNRDRIEPGGGPGSLDGDHTFGRFNPAAGVTFSPSASLNVYAGYSEGSRAPTSIELGCADPDQPCKLPNAMAGDPPLDQVVTRTLEAGVRGRVRPIQLECRRVPRREPRRHLFVASKQTGFGYFKNFGEDAAAGHGDRRQRRTGGVTVGGGYTFLDATFQSAETVNGSSNSKQRRRRGGVPGLEGTIEIEPGDRIPLIPRHMLKAFVDVQATAALSVGIDLVAMSGATPEATRTIATSLTASTISAQAPPRATLSPASTRAIA